MTLTPVVDALFREKMLDLLIAVQSLYNTLFGVHRSRPRYNKSLYNSIFGSIPMDPKYSIIYPTKKETHHLELLNSQEDHKW